MSIDMNNKLTEQKQSIEDILNKLQAIKDSKDDELDANLVSSFFNTDDNDFLPVEEENDFGIHKIIDNFQEGIWKKKAIKHCKEKADECYEEIKSLNNQQRLAFITMLNKDNVFLTGEAGTGKSYVTNAFIHYCENFDLERKGHLLVTAPTGVAAINIHGSTIHREFKCGIEPKVEPPIRHRIPNTIRAAKTIIIDEISMCRCDLFDYIAQTIEMVEEETGKSIQLIVIGDFFQLPPVTGKNEISTMKSLYPNSTKFYAFQGKYWNNMDFKCIALSDVERQDNAEYIKYLNKARIGDISCVNFFNENCYHNGSTFKDGITLASTNSEVNKLNEEGISKLNGDSMFYHETVDGDFKSSDCLAINELQLKIGAKVMLLTNRYISKKEAENNTFNLLPEGTMLYQNGSIGTVVDMDESTVTVKLENPRTPIKIVKVEPYTWSKYKYEVQIETKEVETDTGLKVVEDRKLKKEETGSCTQMPLKLAYAVTIHKSQGQTIDGNVNLIPNTFDVGQLYVALSRTTSYKNLCLQTRIFNDKLKCSDEVINFYKTKVNHKDVIYKADPNNLKIELADYLLSLKSQNADEWFEMPESVRKVIRDTYAKLYLLKQQEI